MLDSHPWVHKFHEQLEHAVTLGPEHYIPRLLQKLDVTEPKLERTLFAAYELGRAYQDSSVQENAAKILGSLIPDLEQRLPFYEVMFDIMDQGEFREEIGSPVYDLSEPLFRQLCGQLKNKTSNALRFILPCARQLAFVPGRQFNAVCGEIKERHQLVGLIADYLHRPMSEILAVQEPRSCAAVYYEHLVLGK